VNLRIDADAAVFSSGGVVAGRYALSDRFKPYLHPLRTPAGHLVSDCMPADHRHHKGLMYGLRCADLNFWEELPGTDQAGVQASLSVEAMEAGPGAAGLRQRLRWQHESGARATYDETREIVCRRDDERRAFVWIWRSRRVALRAHRLIKSEWSLPLEDGRRINYHGLGIRLPWMWAFKGEQFAAVERAGSVVPWREANGDRSPDMGFRGPIDGHWEPPVGAVAIRQEHGFGWFVLKDGFAYLATGPTWLEERELDAGHVSEETYEIVVQDR
jgi:hypothetical protein